MINSLNFFFNSMLSTFPFKPITLKAVLIFICMPHLTHSYTLSQRIINLLTSYTTVMLFIQYLTFYSFTPIFSMFYYILLKLYLLHNALILISLCNTTYFAKDTFIFLLVNSMMQTTIQLLIYN